MSSESSSRFSTDDSSYVSTADSSSSRSGSTTSSEGSDDMNEVEHSVSPQYVVAGTTAISYSSSCSSPAAISTASSTQSGTVRRVRLNPQLIFEQPDVCWIDVPPGAGNMLRRIVANYDVFPEGCYRLIDYLRAAVEMFITQVRQEYMHQRQQAQKNGRELTRFTWRNKGELAICFAACCDMLKLLHDRFRAGPEKTIWESLVNQFILFLMTESRIPQTLLSEQTYYTKYLDWRKGGTRYQGEQLVSNVRFPSAEERRIKVETYLRSGAVYTIESTGVEPPTRVHPPTPISTASDTPIVSQTMQSSVATTGEPIPPFVGFPRGQAPVKKPGEMRVKAPPALIAGKQTVDEYRHLKWLAKLTQITGVSPTLEFPEERSHMILAFVRFCETSDMPDHFVTIMNILVNSSLKIQDAFERGGGMVVLRRFLGTLAKLKDAGGLINLVEQILRMKLSSWSHSSQQSWLRDLAGNSGNNLRWLRSLDVIPTDKQATWNAMVLTLEQQYVLSTSREEKVQRGAKRTRVDSEEALCISMADNVGVGKPTQHISTALCVSLPSEFRAPPLSSEIEQNTICFLNKKMQFCEGVQVSWRDAILKALNGRCPGLPIPLWYDPYQLLGVDPYPSG